MEAFTLIQSTARTLVCVGAVLLAAGRVGVDVCEAQDASGAVMAFVTGGTMMDAGNAPFVGYGVGIQLPASIRPQFVFQHVAALRTCKLSVPPVCDTPTRSFTTVTVGIAPRLYDRSRWYAYLRPHVGLGFRSRGASQPLRAGLAVGIGGDALVRLNERIGVAISAFGLGSTIGSQLGFAVGGSFRI
jgi:hypothetical protein